MELTPRNASVALILCCIVATGVSLLEDELTGDEATSNGNGLRVGFYRSSCPQAENIVQETVQQAVTQNSGIAAGLLRLHFHDCFVRGCDGSVLLNSTPSGEPVETTSQANIGLRGFSTIEAAKTRLEAECPDTVSCADIVAFAARDAAVLSRFPFYLVPSGRRDGNVSSAREIPGNLPVPFSRDVQAQIQIFTKKGLSHVDLVTLLGAHSVGRLHCKVIESQIKSDGGEDAAPFWSAQELGIDPMYVEHLRQRCPNNANETSVVSLNPSPPPLNRILSNKYYENVIDGRAALMSDQALMYDSETMNLVMEMSSDEELWIARFQNSMVKMGMVEVLTGNQGQIRKSCGIVNR